MSVAAKKDEKDKYAPQQQEFHKATAPEEGWSRWFCRAKCPHGPHSPGRGLHTDSYWKGVKGSLIFMKNKDKNDNKSGVVMAILGIFTVVSKKGDGFSLGPGNVKLVRVKGGKVIQCFIIHDKCFALCTCG